MTTAQLNLIPIRAMGTLGRATYFLVRTFDGEPTRRASWQLVNGPANASVPEDEVAPPDYDAAENNRHWVKVGGG